MHLNNKGFAISGVLYSMLILIVTLMFLILGILAGRRTTLNKISSESQESVEDRVVLIEKTVCSSIDFNTATFYTFDSADLEQTVDLSQGFYLIQAWGASGTKNNNNVGGKGAYVSTIYQVEGNETLYLNLGGNYNDDITNQNLAYNGGGSSKHGGSGGGATSVATTSGELSTLSGKTDSIILVAAGGGGAGYTKPGGAGGDLIKGLDGAGYSDSYYGKGATATAGGAGGAKHSNRSTSPGKAGVFGRGGNAGSYSSNYNGGGGGGGYYGGGGGTSSSNKAYGSGGGGVSYINADVLTQTNTIMDNGGIFATKPDYKDYIGVGINGTEPSPKPVHIQTEGILMEPEPGNTSTGAVRITKLNCTTTTTTY